MRGRFKGGAMVSRETQRRNGRGRMKFRPYTISFGALLNMRLASYVLMLVKSRESGDAS